ncbi:MAG: hypothetical protein HN742_31610 [Lentisphaerae bacterium]|nr:hypothetical protein [Lentisphaerota bacterium]MBT4820399.1 hypothetical protein [Lentisphaerota bacterium]MBT5606460.1 hypothetical protein [Lentisphaerota bacterium]MBT7055678.1 hypothetical protein [Lentisphaerota bacterium]MBT7846459.1 hypothetical protein [Lentisphaerota bacterium]
MTDLPPLAYLLTFSCYGAWLPGDKRGSVDRDHRIHGSPLLPPNEPMEGASRHRMGHPAFELASRDARTSVLDGVATRCGQRGWDLLAAHVRITHVHVVLRTRGNIDSVLAGLKGGASNALNREFPEDRGRKRWARHGSTRYLWRPEDVEAAIHYVVHEQGAPMSVYQKEPNPLDSPRGTHSGRE